jgi:hypothetical protein
MISWTRRNLKGEENKNHQLKMVNVELQQEALGQVHHLLLTTPSFP